MVISWLSCFDKTYAFLSKGRGCCCCQVDCLASPPKRGGLYAGLVSTTFPADSKDCWRVCVCVEVSLPPVADSQVLRKDTVMGLPIFDSTSDVLGIY